MPLLTSAGARIILNIITLIKYFKKIVFTGLLVNILAVTYNCYYDKVWYGYYRNVLMDDPYVEYDSRTGEPADPEYAKYYENKEKSLPYFHTQAKQVFDLSRSPFWFLLTAINIALILIMGFLSRFNVKEIYPYLVLFVILLGCWSFYFIYVFD